MYKNLINPLKWTIVKTTVKTTLSWPTAKRPL